MVQVQKKQEDNVSTDPRLWHTNSSGDNEGGYWDTILVMSVNNKYTFNKSNVFEKLKTQHKGNVWAHPFTYPFDAK